MRVGLYSPCFEQSERKKMTTKESQEIICTIGDQITDLMLPGGNTCAIKLPDADSRCSYAYLPYDHNILNNIKI